MKIDPKLPAPEHSGTSPIRDAQVERGKDPSARRANVPSDTVQLSSNQTTIRKLVSDLQQVPDVREDRVRSLRAEIQSGRFERSNAQVADALASELLSVRSNR